MRIWVTAECVDETKRQQLIDDALAAAQAAADFEALKQAKAKFLGKKGAISQLNKSMRSLQPEERKALGQIVQNMRSTIEQGFAERETFLQEEAIEAQLQSGRVDVTLPGRRHVLGVPHPLRQVIDEICDALRPLGFDVVDGPWVEHEWYNFDALNMPEEHPARDMQDTFYIGPQTVMRTQTSNIQIRMMETTEPPLRILAPGMVFRKDDIDPTHSPVFHQIEGLWVDRSVTFADLKGVLRKLAMDMFGDQTTIRFRPSYFPFTEPSTEVDVSCVHCSGKGCRICSYTGWLEILGAGMVNPRVFEAVGYDSKVYQGFAFGAGIERIAMLRWQIPDIRMLYENDLRFLGQFSHQSRL